MEGTISKYYKKLCAIRWIIGFSRCDIAEIIRSGNFEPEIKWMKIPNIKKFFADPFICSINGKVINVLYEEFLISENYGIISSLQVDDSFQIIDNNTGRNLNALRFQEFMNIGCRKQVTYIV